MSKMSPKKAFEIVSEFKNVALYLWDNLYNHYDKDTYNALVYAADALKKQIPKKPIPITRNEHATKIIGYGCPNCKKDVIGSGFYCWCCGQRLDWSECDAEIH